MMVDSDNSYFQLRRNEDKIALTVFLSARCGNRLNWKGEPAGDLKPVGQFQSQIAAVLLDRILPVFRRAWIPVLPVEEIVDAQ